MGQSINGKSILETVPTTDSAANQNVADVTGNKNDTTGGTSLVSISNQIGITCLEAVSSHLVPLADDPDNVRMSDVIGNKTDTIAGDSLVSLVKGVGCVPVDLYTGKNVTATLFVSPNGDNSDGLSWATAFTTIQGALAAASTDVNECTRIVIGINTGANHYDIDITGDPTYTGNYVIEGTHRTWQKIMNTHASATSILKFTGYVELKDLNFNLGGSGTDPDVNGVIITKGAFRVDCCQFTGENLGSAKTALHLDGATLLKHGKVIGCTFRGEVTKSHMTGILIDNTCCSKFRDCDWHECLTAVQIVGADSDINYFDCLDIGDCTTGFDIDAGNEHHFDDINLHDNGTNFDCVTTDHNFNNINVEINTYLSPINNIVGIEITGGSPGYGSDTEIVALNAIGNPFKVIGYYLEPEADENTLIRLSADAGTSHFTEAIFAAKKGKATGSGIATDFIFNANTRISGSVYPKTNGKYVRIWLEIQEF